jgi:N-methylhydantoinase A/oxoprolinase/acetone carboxylase beta subunit
MGETTTERLSRHARLLKQKQELEAEIRKSAAKERTQRVAREEAMDFAVGRAVRTEMAEHAEFAAAVTAILERRLTKARERQLFGLTPLDPEKAAPEESAAAATPSSDSNASEAA